jgi:Rieske Fe-S protein
MKRLRKLIFSHAISFIHALCTSTMPNGTYTTDIAATATSSSAAAAATSAATTTADATAVTSIFKWKYPLKAAK